MHTGAWEPAKKVFIAQPTFRLEGLTAFLRRVVFKKKNFILKTSCYKISLGAWYIIQMKGASPLNREGALRIHPPFHSPHLIPPNSPETLLRKGSTRHQRPPRAFLFWYKSRVRLREGWGSPRDPPVAMYCLKILVLSYSGHLFTRCFSLNRMNS